MSAELQKECVSVCVCPTLPRTAVQLHPHADCGWQFGDRKQPDVARDDGRVEVIDDWGVRVFVALYHLQINCLWHFMVFLMTNYFQFVLKKQILQIVQLFFFLNYTFRGNKNDKNNKNKVWVRREQEDCG